MKKLGLLGLVTVLALSMTTSIQAKEKKDAPGGVEFSGGVSVVGPAWQHDSKNAQPQFSHINSSDFVGVGGGQLGEFRGLQSGKRDTFNFYIDSVELDLNKTFGENIRLRADLDFGRYQSGSFNTFSLEQAYITMNLPIGKGAELLFGRFNTPIGYEAVDRRDNVALSYSNIFRYLRPHNTTGMKLYYAFSEHFDWNMYVVNNLHDTIQNDTTIPSFGTRFGFNWGEKGKESVIGFSYAAGPEAASPVVTGLAPVSLGASNLKKHWSHIADLDFSFHLSDSFLIAGEMMYRQDNKGGACSNLSNAGKARNCKAIAGQLLLGYKPSETWTLYGRYGYLHDLQGNYTAVDQQIHDFSLGVNYQIAEGAKMKAEYRLDLNIPGGGAKKFNSNAFALAFDYNF